VGQVSKIGAFSSSVIKLLNLDIPINTPIFIGESNILHMKNNHPVDFEKYFPVMAEIIAEPDYVCINKKDGSLEYVKEYKPDQVKVAVRVSTNGTYYARTLYVLNNQRVLDFIEKGILKRVKQS